MASDPHVPGDFVAVSIVEFADGDISGMLLHRGTRDECTRTRDLVPALAVSDPRPVVRGGITVMPAAEWDELQSRGNDE